MNDLREYIILKLNEIKDLEVSPEIPDNMLEKNKTYFSFSLQKIYEGSDIDKNYTYRISLLGYVKRIQNSTENTLQIVDNISSEIEKKLKDINIKCNFADVSVLDNLRKIQVQGNARYNEINKRIV